MYSVTMCVTDIFVVCAADSWSASIMKLIVDCAIVFLQVNEVISGLRFLLVAAGCLFFTDVEIVGDFSSMDRLRC